MIDGKVQRAVRAGLTVLAGIFPLACTTLPAAQTVDQPALCEDASYRIYADFPGAGQHRCLVVGEGEFLLRVDPELIVTPPINPSPWFAFDIQSRAPGAVSVTLDYGGYRHRYEPKWQRPGEEGWAVLDADAIEVLDEGHRVRLDLDLPAGRTRIAAQPLRTPFAVATWMQHFANAHDAQMLRYGASRNARPLDALVLGPQDASRVVIALTRQHPPERSGGDAFEGFAERVAGLQEAGALDGVRVLLLPLVNPDGLAGGYWRLGAGGVDLNRDWFTAHEPEIAAAQALIRREAGGRQVLAFLDFHSTRRTLVYNPPAGTAAQGDALMAELARRLADELDPDPDWIEGHNADTGTSKAWALEAFDFAGLTVEVADEASPDAARHIGAVVADAVAAVAHN